MSYICETCQKPVRHGDGYIHSRTVGQWHINHRSCAGDLTDSVCFSVPEHWADLLNAHRYYVRRARAAA